MQMKLAAIMLAYIILFAASVPVYASHTKKMVPSDVEKRLFAKIFERLQKHDEFIDTKIDDVKKSLSETLKISIPCKNVDDSIVDSVFVTISTELINFDSSIAERHDSTIGAVYVWDCRAVNDGYAITIECTNMIMLNPTYMIREEASKREEKVVSMAENEMILYHELLHGQLLINVMGDNSDKAGWRAEACRNFPNNENTMDYTASDPDHVVIAGLQLKYLSKLIEENGGLVIVKTIDKEIGREEFTKVVASPEELGKLAETGFLVFARTTNLEGAEIIVDEKTLALLLNAVLQDAAKDASIMMYVMPRLDAANTRLELAVDDPVKSAGSEFLFTAKVQNMQADDLQGSLSLLIDDFVIMSKQVSIQSGRTVNVEFMWSDDEPSVHSAQVKGLDSVSNEVSVMTFERLVSDTGNAVIAEQSVTDASGTRWVVAKPERISATISGEARLVAPDGTIVIGENGIVNIGKKVNIVNVSGHILMVKYAELNEKLRFVAVKNTEGPLPAGEWHIYSDAKIRYYATYVKNEPPYTS
jgi:hypothetical protein